MSVETAGEAADRSARLEAPGPSGAVGRPAVAVVGPRLESRGGIAAMARLLHDSRLASEFRLVQISTQRDGGGLSKALEAARGLTTLAGLCAGRRVDLVHLHVSTRGSLARKSLAVAIARATRVPVILHVHSGGLLGPERVRTDVLGRVQRRTLRWALESSDTVVALTPSWERRLEAQARIRRSAVIPNAPDLTVPLQPRPAGPGRLVLFLGHLYREKGVYDLLDAFSQLRATHPDLRLVLAGEGSESRGIRTRAAELGVSSAVQLPGWVGPRRKAELLAEAACLALPSYSEGLPLVLLEAMHAGVPIVASAVGGVPDLVADSREALLVTPRDADALARALGRVLDDRVLAARLSANARRRAAAEYTPAAFAARIGDVYREALAGR